MLLVSLKRRLKVVFILPRLPSWSYDLNHLYTLSFPLPKKGPHEILFLLTKPFQSNSSLKLVDDADGRRQTPEHGFTIS